MSNKLFLVAAASFLIVWSSCSQPKAESGCEQRVDQLYEKHKLHFIFCAYYFDEVNNLSHADAVADNLSFYRDSADAPQKDSVVVSNLKKNVCQGDTSILAKMDKWCETSEKVAAVRAGGHFTLEGYMEFLISDSLTSTAVSPFLNDGRTIYSLSSSELEMVYFKSIGVMSFLPEKEQDTVLSRLTTWDFK